jgi:hypothetical protein
MISEKNREIVRKRRRERAAASVMCACSRIIAAGLSQGVQERYSWEEGAAFGMRF